MRRCAPCAHSSSTPRLGDHSSRLAGGRGWQTDPEQNPSGLPVAKRRFLISPCGWSLTHRVPAAVGIHARRPRAGAGRHRAGALDSHFAGSLLVPASPRSGSSSSIDRPPSPQLLLITAAINSHAAFHVRAHVLALRSPRGGLCPAGSTGHRRGASRWGRPDHGTGQGTDTPRGSVTILWLNSCCSAAPALNGIKTGFFPAARDPRCQRPRP